MRPLLERLPILRSRDISQAQAFLSARNICLEVTGPSRNHASFDVRYNGIYLPGMWFGYIEYGAGVTARVSPRRGDYWAHFPLEGRLESSMGRSHVECDSRRGVITSPCETHVVRSQAHAARLSISINGSALTGQLAALLDDVPRAPLEFSAGIDLETGRGRSLSRALRCAAVELEGHDWLRSPLAASQFEQSVMTALLLSQPSNYAQALGDHIHPIAPRDVARAVDYIHENLAEPMTLADLVRESGVAGRTLLKHFRDFKGVSPMRYLRNLRLKRVREELENGAGMRVSESAQRWGFPHAGRFSVEYRKRFGESPSATLARRRT